MKSITKKKNQIQNEEEEENKFPNRITYTYEMNFDWWWFKSICERALKSITYFIFAIFEPFLSWLENAFFWREFLTPNHNPASIVRCVYKCICLVKHVIFCVYVLLFHFSPSMPSVNLFKSGCLWFSWEWNIFYSTDVNTIPCASSHASLNPHSTTQFSLLRYTQHGKKQLCY